MLQRQSRECATFYFSHGGCGFYHAVVSTPANARGLVEAGDPRRLRRVPAAQDGDHRRRRRRHPRRQGRGVGHGDPVQPCARHTSHRQRVRPRPEPWDSPTTRHQGGLRRVPSVSPTPPSTTARRTPRDLDQHEIDGPAEPRRAPGATESPAHRKDPTCTCASAQMRRRDSTRAPSASQRTVSVRGTPPEPRPRTGDPTCRSTSAPRRWRGRREPAAAAIRAAGLDGLLCFKQESMYWLTGYDSSASACSSA